MRHVKTSQAELFIFDSMTQLVEECDHARYEKQPASFVGEQGLTDWDTTEARSKRDWAEGMYTLKEYTEKLSREDVPEIKSHKRQTQFASDEGDELDYDRLMSGQADFWRVTKREASTGETTVTVIIDTTTPASKNVKDILWRGASAIALTKILEEKGYSVELWVVNGSDLYAGKQTHVVTAACLKRPSDPLDESTIINTVAGWFYRTITFTMLRTICDKQGEQVSCGLGSCYTPDQNDLDNLTTDGNRVYSSGVYTFDGALNLMQAELQKLAELE